jgi:DNA-binding CsgD family transcriptional regulator
MKSSPARRIQDDLRDAFGPAQALRKSGIISISEIAWGAHICVFYETKQDLLDANVPYLKAGLEGNEFCVWAISDPLTETDAKNALRCSVPDLDERLDAGQIELIPGTDWYLPGGEFDLQRITGGWHHKLRLALAKGYDGMRVSGNAFWIGTNHFQKFTEYEHELDRSLAGQKMVVLCTYSLSESRVVDLLDVARAHQFTITRRCGGWEFLETPGRKHTKQEVAEFNGDIWSRPFPGHDTLTSREREVLAELARGYSSKEIARQLGIVPRTVEFHRANLLKKVGARSTIDLIRIVLGE